MRARSLILVVGLVAPACVAPGRTSEPSAAAIVLDVTEFPQEEAFECGLAALTMLGAYHDAEIPAPLREDLRATAARQKGLSGAQMRGALVLGGLEAYLIEGRLDESVAGLQRQIQHGRPVLVELAGEDGELHAALLAGYDPLSGDLQLLDPARGACWLPAEEFADAWRGAGAFALVAGRAESFDASERADLRSLEQAADPELALQIAGDIHLTGSDVLLVVAVVLLVAILI